MAQLSSMSSSWEGTMKRGEGTEEGSRTQANEDGARAGMGWLTWLLALHYLQTGVNSSCEDLALLWCWEEKWSCTGITTEHINFLSNTNTKKKKKTFMNFSSWTFSQKKWISVDITQNGQYTNYIVHKWMHVFFDIDGPCCRDNVCSNQIQAPNWPAVQLYACMYV